VELGSLTPQAAAFLEASLRAGLNILVAGARRRARPRLRTVRNGIVGRGVRRTYQIQGMFSEIDPDTVA